MGGPAWGFSVWVHNENICEELQSLVVLAAVPSKKAAFEAQAAKLKKRLEDAKANPSAAASQKDLEDFENILKLTKKDGAARAAINKAGIDPNAYKVPASQFTVGRHGEMPSPRPGQQSHHGAMSAWVRNRHPHYDPDLAPAVLMPEANHQATFGVYNTWRAQMRQRMGGTFDWSRVSEAEMRALSESMFDAAQVPVSVRQQYWAEYQRMMRALQRQAGGR